MHNARAEVFPHYRSKTMKKFFLTLAAVATLVAVTGCNSLRTPSTGEHANKVYYWTFFGISIESAVYGDNLLVK